MLSLRKSLAVSVLCAVASVGFVMSVSAENVDDEKLVEHQLKGIIVEEDVENYDSKIIRTGGDVDIVTSKDIEKHHYSDITEILKRIPGVDVQTVGYKAFEYGYNTYQDSVSINGDSRVLILIDGKRLTNEANSSVNGEHSKAQLFAMVPPQNIERIEVIKGAAAMAYGSDATGGVINIITKKVNMHQLL